MAPIDTPEGALGPVGAQLRGHADRRQQFDFRMRAGDDFLKNVPHSIVIRLFFAPFRDQSFRKNALLAAG